MRIVSNTGPIIGLAQIGMIHLLKDLAGEVLIPPFVHKELFGKTGPETIHIENALGNFIKVAPVNVFQPSEADVLSELDEGEKQAVSLASELGDDVLLLIDDRAGWHGKPGTGFRMKSLESQRGSQRNELYHAAQTGCPPALLFSLRS